MEYDRLLFGLLYTENVIRCNC